jgi:hypothetical protein
MGSAGHAFVSHTKALSPPAQTKDGGYGPPPHPVRVLPGMRFLARRSRRTRVLVVTGIAGEKVHCRPEDEPPGRRRVTARLDRLLATSDDGQGLHYRFAGYSKRQGGYRTMAQLIAVRDDRALLCLPEWHPSRPACIFADLVPGDARVGDWLALRAHLDASRSGHLKPSKLAICEPPPPELAERVDVEEPQEPAARPVPELGPGCGDIVICVSAEELERLRRPGRDRWARHLYVHRNRPPASFEEGLDPTDLPSGAGVWLAREGRVHGRFPLTATEQNPNGTLLFLGAEIEAEPRAEKCRHFHGWRWRWWPQPGV